MSTTTDLGLTLPTSTDKIDVKTQISDNFQIVEDELAKKQDALTAGDNITIEDGTISAAGTDLSDYYTKEQADLLLYAKQGTLTAGDNITINDDNTISATINGATETVGGVVKLAVVKTLPDSPQSDCFYFVTADTSADSGTTTE